MFTSQKLLTALVCLALPLPAFAQPKQPPMPRLPEGTHVEKNLEYGPHERNKLDLYVPKSEKPLPLLIWVHGGGWQNGSKEGGGPAIGFLDKGYAVASINYRLSSHAQFPAQIEDCLAAVRFLRANAKKYNLDPDHFGAWGSSAGGHLVAMMGTASDVKEFLNYGAVRDGSSRVQAVVDYYGPTDFLQMNAQSKKKGPIDHDAPMSPGAKLIGGPIQENKEKVAKANPITFATKDDAPFLILHGDADLIVPQGQSEILEAALKKVGVPCELIIVPNVGHDHRVGQGENAEKIARFFEKHLKGK